MILGAEVGAEIQTKDIENQFHEIMADIPQM
jgi:hypothetical protein